MKTAIELDAAASALEAQAQQLRRDAASQRGRDREAARQEAAKIPVDRDARQLTDGAPVPEDGSHNETDPRTGQNKGYVVLTEAERAKGFVRPVRDAYRHVGARPEFPTRDLTDEERERYAQYGYVVFEPYPSEAGRGTGMFWTEKGLTSGCGAVTTMSREIAETYARDPAFYGSTFCTRCGGHHPVGARGEFVWLDAPSERVGT